MKSKTETEDKVVWPVRINRYMAIKGFSTRRGADELILAGKVSINGKKAILGDRVKESDKVDVMVKGKNGTDKFTYFVYYKPRGIVTVSSQKGEKEIKDLIKMPNMFPIGRLDKESEGMIILTNDGRITDRLLNPRFTHEKEYEVRVREKIHSNAKNILEGGVISEGEKLTAKNVEELDNHKLRIILTEGKRHQIRRMLDNLHLTVESLKRVRIMDIRLGSLKLGESRELKGLARKAFLKNLGLEG